MILVKLCCRVVAGLGFLIALLLWPLQAIAQRPVISSCAASPLMVAPGETATIHVQATSPSGLPMHYIFTASTGTLQSDGASATLTVDKSAKGIVTVLCEARDSHDSWVRSRTWIKLVGTANADFATPKATPAKPESATGAVAASGAKIAPLMSPAPPAPLTPPAPPATVAHSTPSSAAATPVPVPPQAAPAVLSAAPAKTSGETIQAVPNNAATNEWVKQSKDGLIEYTVQQKMVVGKASKVTVQIHGYSVAANATRAGSLTAQYLKVLLMAEDPSGLKIVSQGRTDIQYVPKNKTATWVWNVTPMGTAASQNLQVRVFEEYKTDGERSVDGASYTVDVLAPSPLTRAKEAYFDDPDAWWKYWLPSGAIGLLLFVLLLRLMSRRKETGGGTVQNFEASDWL